MHFLSAEFPVLDVSREWDRVASRVCSSHWAPCSHGSTVSCVCASLLIKAERCSGVWMDGTTFWFFIHPLMDIWGVSALWLL